MSKKTKAATDRAKHTVYTDCHPEVEKGIRKAVADGRVFSAFCVNALRDWLKANNYLA